MPTSTLTSPGDVLAPFTAAAVAAPQDFTSSRSNALVQLTGTEPWEFSSDGTNYAKVSANKGQLFPFLVGQGQTATWTFRRSGATDSIISVQVVG